MLIALVTSVAEAIMEAAPWTPRLYARHGGYVLAVGALLVSARVLAAVLSPAGQAARTDPSPPSKAGTVADLRSPETGDRIRVSTDSLLYIESDGNYVHIHSSGPNGAEHHMLRCSLQHAESRLTDLPIVRCHRRYLVNSRRVVEVSHAGRAAVVRLLTERGDDVRVPVARSRAAEVRRLVGTERGRSDSAASRREAL
jgi:DNA-binding LytR/AlgR family response regulator